MQTRQLEFEIKLLHSWCGQDGHHSPLHPQKPFWEQATNHRGHPSDSAPRVLYQEAVIQMF